MTEIKSEFDYVVVNLNKSIINEKDENTSYLFLKIINKVKRGGYVFIPESTYNHIPHGRIGVEALIKVLNLIIELPMHKANKVVIASKN